MSAPSTRRRLFGASAAMLLLAAPAAGATKAAELDGRLLRLVIDLEDLHARAHGPETAASDDALEALLDDYWAVADQIEDIPARTPEGIQAKSRALRSVIIMVGQPEGHVKQHTDSLLRDIAGTAAT